MGLGVNAVPGNERSVAGRDDGVGSAAFDEVNRPAHGTVLFTTDSLHGRIMHFNDLAGVRDFDARVADIEFAQLRLKARFVAVASADGVELKDFESGETTRFEQADAALAAVLRGRGIS